MRYLNFVLGKTNDGLAACGQISIYDISLSLHFEKKVLTLHTDAWIIF